MCGCMLMHSAMDHGEHQISNQPASASQPSPIPASSGLQCAHCGIPLGQDFAFCPNCGLNLKTAECPACGQKVEPAWNTCAYCGSPLGEVEKQPA